MVAMNGVFRSSACWRRSTRLGIRRWPYSGKALKCESKGRVRTISSWHLRKGARPASKPTRRKNGIASVHLLRGPELRTLRRLQRDYPHTAYVFVSERKAPLTVDAVRKIVNRAGREAGIAFQVHPHMLRHATGYKLANDGQDTRAIQQYLGHRNIQNTTRYTELAPDRFKDFWRD